MTSSAASKILEQLLSGIHPVTGEILPDDHVCAEPEVIRALHRAIMALQETSQPARSSQNTHPLPLNKKNGLPNAGRPWTKEDDTRLRELFYLDTPVEEICRALQRRPRGIIKRLTLLRLMPVSPDAPAHEIKPGLENAGLPWYPEDDEKLIEMFETRMPLDSIMAHFKRSKGAIDSRMVRLGLTEFKGQYVGRISPWKNSDTALLISMYQKNQDLSSIAKHFECTEESVRARLIYLGLIKQPH